MDRTVPNGAALLLDFIGKVETGRAGREGYDVIYSHAQGKLPRPITSMTIAELQAHQAHGWPAKSTASGRYQFMKATLADLRRELRLRDDQIFDPDLQDRLGYHLLKRRGYEAFMEGKISVAEFGKRLAMEWASLPVLEATKGAHRMLKRGQSYYSGDALNKSLVSPEEVETLLAIVLSAENPTERPSPTPAPQTPDKATTPVSDAARLVITLFILAGLALFIGTLVGIFS